MNQRQSIGKLGEDLAVAYVESLGWQVIARNWRYSHLGEIDIVAVEPSSGKGILVFLEVKAKTGTGYGEPLEAITYEKLKRLHRLAHAWIATHEMGYDRVRIDAIGIVARQGEDPALTHARAVRL